MDDHKRRVGLFGGSFNPPHICHLLSSVFLLEGKTVDEVWWLPVHRHAFAKDRELAPWEQRLAMCEAAASCHPAVHVSDIEARLQPPSFTFDTLAALRTEHPDTDFSWVIGSDLLDDLPRWHRWTELR
ncbi:MAG: nicotinate-nicotinamide nucleotide adenylyltransferase, partial [Myxococcota bacterium]|nr:nicotinate-nicotinamide nucleotide adenylyltransferase [Myxococcota bacterium]